MLHGRDFEARDNESGAKVAILNRTAMQLLRHQLYEIGLLDWPSIFIALLVLGASAVLAGYVPARRAARAGPLVALRES
ncbi:MAG: hypothetical protein JJD97_07935 [Gemmatimonadaceae bacterium]|nr:hypothetical protein [Gemmatimonadaceae bacterium]